MTTTRLPAIPGELARDILETAKAQGALLFGQFRLSSGQVSSYYFDGRMLTLSPKGADLVAKALLPAVRAAGAEAVGGPTLGADPMVTAIAMRSHQDGGRELPAFIVRKESKEHGTGKIIEGHAVGDGQRVAIVDDACSTAGSLYHAIRAAEAIGCKVVLVASIVDRHQGGSDRLRADGYVFHTILEADEQGNIRPAG
ncbi:MAG: orotate phosphoribosyltransferase [SAR202 cluster bacterium]|nr:orotate phosphoribosyltransferase [SAR202 cluster bacterium]